MESVLLSDFNWIHALESHFDFAPPPSSVFSALSSDARFISAVTEQLLPWVLYEYILPFLYLFLAHQVLYAAIFGIPTFILFGPFAPFWATRAWKYQPNTFPSRSQILQEMRRTCGSSALIDTAYLYGFLFWRSRTSHISGYMDTGEYKVESLLQLLLLAILWADSHFYFTHRLLHTRWLFQKIHIVHHKSGIVNPYSGLSFHPVEALIYFSSQLVYLVHPIHIVNYYLLKIGLSVFPINGHLGHGFRSPRCLVGGYHHHLHHTLKTVNYGAALGPSIWDVLLGTACDGEEHPQQTKKSQ